MYLSTSNNFLLDQVVKSFEVAYRSHIVETLKIKYPTLSDFSVAIFKVNSSIENSSLILSKKFKSKVQKIKQELSTHFQKIELCFTSFQTQDYSDSVPYVSEIIDYVNLFFNDCFQNLAAHFITIEEFNDYSSKYQLLRNALSHPASSKIDIQHAKEVISFIKKISLVIEDDKFWYVSKKELNAKADSFIKNIENSQLKTHNLEEVSFPHSKIVCRNAELDVLRSLLFGKDESYRKSGSIIIYGYGGVGKTALSLEFIYQTIKEINDGLIKNPYDFVLFFTSKEEVLDYKQTSGELYISSIRKQIDSFKDFKNKVFEELNYKDQKFDIKDKGLIVVDNFETLSNEDKNLFLDFIKHSPRAC